MVILVNNNYNYKKVRTAWKRSEDDNTLCYWDNCSLEEGVEGIIVQSESTITYGPRVKLLSGDIEYFHPGSWNEEGIFWELVNE